MLLLLVLAMLVPTEVPVTPTYFPVPPVTGNDVVGDDDARFPCRLSMAMQMSVSLIAELVGTGRAFRWCGDDRAVEVVAN